MHEVSLRLLYIYSGMKIAIHGQTTLHNLYYWFDKYFFTAIKQELVTLVEHITSAVVSRISVALSYIFLAMCFKSLFVFLPFFVCSLTHSIVCPSWMFGLCLPV